MDTKTFVFVLAVFISLITFTLTYLLVGWRMRGQYVTVTTMEKYTQERQDFESKTKERLRGIQDQLIVGNLIMLDLCEVSNIASDKVESYRRAVTAATSGKE